MVGCKYNRISEPSMTTNGMASHDGIQVIPISTLKSMYKGGPTAINDNIAIEGVVVSDDSEGNFYKSMIIQDPTSGIELKLSMANMSTLYPQGSKVRLLCNSFVLGNYGNQVNLGYKSNNPKYETSYFPELLIPKVLFIVGKTNLTPIEIPSFSQINKNMQGMLVMLNNVQFDSSNLGLTFGDTSKDKKTLNRILKDQNGAQLQVRTSAYARFASTTIPNGSGSIVGIITYFGNTPQLLINKIGDVHLINNRF